VRKVVILTSAFPYLPGEQFLEDEIPYWSEAEGVEVILMPATASGAVRDIPEDIEINLSLVGSSPLSRHRLMKMLWLPPAVTSRLFICEIRYLLSSNRLSLKNVLYALQACANVLIFQKKLNKYISKEGCIDIVYSYWNESLAYAACLLKRHGKVGSVISRAHGFDLYESRRKTHYMALKRQFIADFDKIFLLSEEAKSYFEQTYGTAAGILGIAPLGVPLPSKVSARSRAGEAHIVSVSFCVAIKRLDKILAAVSLFSDWHPEIQVKWTHIGDGPLLCELKNKCAAEVFSRPRLNIELLGLKSNSYVKNFYSMQPVDVFINASESEGMPVSIMEAMAAGVPAIAPNIGGMANLITHENGKLLTTTPSIKEMTCALEEMLLGDNQEGLRLKAREHISSNFNATRNYSNFVSKLKELPCRHGI